MRQYYKVFFLKVTLKKHLKNLVSLIKCEEWTGWTKQSLQSVVLVFGAWSVRFGQIWSDWSDWSDWETDSGQPSLSKPDRNYQVFLTAATSPTWDKCQRTGGLAATITTITQKIDSYSLWTVWISFNYKCRKQFKQLRSPEVLICWSNMSFFPTLLCRHLQHELLVSCSSHFCAVLGDTKPQTASALETHMKLISAFSCDSG